MSIRTALAWARERHGETESQLEEFVRFPSVSAHPHRAEAVRACGEWLAERLRTAGMDRVALAPTLGHPLVLAEWRRAPGRPTLLIYGHYDVQPEDPLDEWRSPPFEPTRRGEDLYGRGASDDKGQLFAHVKALESCLSSQGRLPVNVRCVFEGEEEVGSTHLLPFLDRAREGLRADVAVMSDTRMLAPGKPAITYSLRGALSCELEVTGPLADLHSGTFGGAVHNPAQALCEILSRFHDAGGRIAIPGFYDRVRLPTEAERARMAASGPKDRSILADAKTARDWGDEDFTLYERTTIRPSLAVTGITAGYQGRGVKAVIPARAGAKFNFRLVPDQDPKEVANLLRRHVTRITPPTVRAALKGFSMARPALIPREHPAMSAAAFAYQQGFGARPAFLRSGGTIPVVNHFSRVLGVPTVLMGFGLPDDRIHAPNEKFHLPNLHRGVETSLWFLHALGRMARPDRLAKAEETPAEHFAVG